MASSRRRAPARRRSSAGGPLTAFALSLEHRLASIDVVEPAEARASSSGRLLELAWDGHRVLACAVGDDVRLVSSDHREWSELFPTVGAALRRLRRKDVAVEGFLCALGEGGLPSFELLRRHVQRQPQRIVLACWDLLRLDGEDLRPLPLVERRARLSALLAGAEEPALVVSEVLGGSFDAVLEGVRRVGGGGVLSRRADEAYPTGDGPATWLAVGPGSLVIDRALSPPPKVTNEDKVMYPRDGLTKRDVVAYYEAVADALLPYMSDRPIVGQRWPDGIDEFTWYQHRMPPRAPDYLRAVSIEGNRRIVVESRDALLWLANQAVLTFHAWASRCASLAHPDWVVIDLDPGERSTWADVVEAATALRRLLELLELPSVPKTSGQRGLHVLVPIAGGQSVLEAHELARRVAKTLETVLPDRVTTKSAVADRAGRLYVDTLQNFVGKTLVLPYSLRAVDGAPVSTPLAWSEVTPKLDPRALTLKTLRRRLDDKGDLAAPLLRGTARLADAIARLPA